MKKLTIENLEAMEPNSIFASGFAVKEHPWFNNTTHMNDGGCMVDERNTIVRWVAVRGGIHDWAIYHSIDANLCPHRYFDCLCHLGASDKRIADHGAKLLDMALVKRLVGADDEAMKMYRK